MAGRIPSVQASIADAITDAVIVASRREGPDTAFRVRGR